MKKPSNYMEKRNKKRSKNIEDCLVDDIVRIIDQWGGTRLTWSLLIDEIELLQAIRYTRQALAKYTKIQIAFSLKKEALTGPTTPPKRKVSQEVQMLLDENSKLKHQLHRYQKEADQMLEQFARWIYNAGLHNLSLQDLNKPLPDSNRR